MLKLTADCPYCQKLMRATLLNLSPDGIHYLREPYNIPESWNYEGYDFRCGNKHHHIMITVHEYYYRQYSDHDEFCKAHDEYEGPRTKIGYKPLGMNNFDGTVKFARLLIGFDIGKKYYAYFIASPGETPIISVGHANNPYMQEFNIACDFEWLSWSPDKIVEMAKLKLQEHTTEFNRHYENCQEEC